MIEDLLRGFVREPWIEKLDFATLERVNSSHVAENLQGRDGDVVWRLRLRGDPSALVYVLVEFQSEVERFMALRQSVYQGLFYQQLVKQGELTPDGLLPLVLSIVIYNGKGDWRAPRELAELIRVVEGGSEIYAPRYCFRLIATQSYAPADLRGPNLVALLIRLERSRTRSSLRQVIRDLAAALPRPDEGGLRRAFLVWLRRVLLPGKGKEDIPELVDLEDFRAMLSETVERWNQELMKKGERKGRKKGLAEGLEKGQRDLLLRQLTVKFGTIDDRTRARVEAAGPQRLMKMAERLLTAERLADVFAR
jgi:hypothetical protein